MKYAVYGYTVNEPELTTGGQRTGWSIPATYFIICFDETDFLTTQVRCGMYNVHKVAEVEEHNILNVAHRIKKGIAACMNDEIREDTHHN